LSSGYTDPRLVYLVGQSNGKILWFSEHEVVDDAKVEVDMSDWQPGIVQFALVNAAERIEGEHVFFNPDKHGKDVEFSVNISSPAQRSKITASTKALDDGWLVFSVANDPWLSEQLQNHGASILALPYDFLEEPISYSNWFRERSNDPATFQEVVHLYTPNEFAWSNILHAKGDYGQPGIDEGVAQNIMQYESIMAFGTELHDNGKIIQRNLIGADFFYTSNPDYIQDLHAEKKEREPTYKKMLENGASILEVLKVVKPYNMQGSNIVFMGSSNSINSQGGALIAIDGINRGTDASVLASISPYDVKSISASTDPNDIHKYTGLNSVGVVEIVLKSGSDTETPEEQIPLGQQFISPDYDSNRSISEFDGRSTLHWLVTPLTKGKETTVNYFNSDLISNVRGTVIFFPTSGIPQSRTFDYQIK